MDGATVVAGDRESAELDAARGSEMDPRAARESASAARRKAITAEIERLWPAHPWAAEYLSVGTDSGMAFEVAPDAGYVLGWFGNWGFETGSFGTVRIVDDALVVRWGDRRYMVRENKAIDFCNHFNLGFERVAPDNGALACRRPDAQAAYGKPQVPPRYDAYLLDTPVRAKIVTVLEETAPSANGWFRMHVQFDAGSRQRVFRGMKLHVLAPRIDGLATVEAVTDVMSLAEIRGYADGERPSVGSELSTSYD
jgi:hypothetical protein